MIRSYILREYCLAVIFQFLSSRGPKLQCSIKVKDGLSEVLIFKMLQSTTLNVKKMPGSMQF